jgi:DNA-binding transcriptional regulator YiaG
MSLKRGFSGISLATAKEVKAARKALGMKRSEFALLLGVGDDKLRAWESGRRQPNELESRVLRLLAQNAEFAAEFIKL